MPDYNTPVECDGYELDDENTMNVRAESSNLVCAMQVVCPNSSKKHTYPMDEDNNNDDDDENGNEMSKRSGEKEKEEATRHRVTQRITML